MRFFFLQDGAEIDIAIFGYIFMYAEKKTMICSFLAILN